MCGRDMAAAAVMSGLLLGTAAVAVLRAVRRSSRGHGQHARHGTPQGQGICAAGAAWPLVRPGCSCTDGCDHTGHVETAVR